MLWIVILRSYQLPNGGLGAEQHEPVCDAKRIKMNIRDRKVHLAFIVIICSLCFTPTFLTAAQTDIDAEIAAVDAIKISELESAKDAEALYDWMHPDAQRVVSRSAVIGWYTEDFFPLDPSPISEIVGVQFIDWVWPVTGALYRNTAEITFIQPFGVGNNITYQQEVVRLVRSGSNWRWFFGRSSEFVEAQIARFPESSISESSSSRPSGTSLELQDSSNLSGIQPASRSSDCTLVELFPGYPGYRGVVTGMLANWGGLGDWICLEYLEAQNPLFDRSRVDSANIAAARELGIDGQPEDWVWENWMQIEAIRGLPVQCYSCILLNKGIVPISTSLRPDYADPRIQAGFLGEQYALRLITSDPTSLKFWGDDYLLRATAFLWSGMRLNAPQLLEKYAEIVEEYETPGGPSLDTQKCLEISLDQGGYTWVPDTARAEDQYLVMGQSWWAATRLQIPFARDAELSALITVSNEWRASGADIPLRQYLDNNRHRLGM